MNLYYILEKYDLLELDNDAAAGIVSALSLRNIESSDVRTLFREELLWFWAAPNMMSGSIQVAIDNGGLPPELELATGELWSSLFGGSATVIRTESDNTIAKRIFDGIDALVILGVMSKDQCESLYALGGGLQAPDTSGADVQQAKDDKAAQDAADQAEHDRMQAEIELRDDWDIAMSQTGAEEAFYNGNKTALIIAINEAVVILGATNA